MVVRQILALNVRVRILAGQHSRIFISGFLFFRPVEKASSRVKSVAAERVESGGA